MSPVDHENPSGTVLRKRFMRSVNLSSSQGPFLMEFKCRFDTSLVSYPKFPGRLKPPFETAAETNCSFPLLNVVETKFNCGGAFIHDFQSRSIRGHALSSSKTQYTKDTFCGLARSTTGEARFNIYLPLSAMRALAYMGDSSHDLRG